MKVFVYRNLRNACWSLRALEGPYKGRVVAHAREVFLADCEFRVSEAGRQRALRERRKNVHAGVVGTLLDMLGEWRILNAAVRLPAPPLPRRYEDGVSYNPYRSGSFEVWRPGARVKDARFVAVSRARAAWLTEAGRVWTRRAT